MAKKNQEYRWKLEAEYLIEGGGLSQKIKNMKTAMQSPQAKQFCVVGILKRKIEVFESVLQNYRSLV